MNENGSKRRDWIKNAAIIFLTVMLLLTFFSNTIMNYSLPEVAVQYVQSGSITAQIRGSGYVESDDPYEVVINESRTVESILVREGDKVEKGEPLIMLSDKESQELQAALDAAEAAQNALDDAVSAFQRELLLADISSDAYNNAQAGNFASVTQYHSQLETARAEVAKYEEEIKQIETKIAQLEAAKKQINAGTVDTSAEEAALAKAREALEVADSNYASAENAYNVLKNEWDGYQDIIDNQDSDGRYEYDVSGNQIWVPTHDDLEVATAQKKQEAMKSKLNTAEQNLNARKAEYDKAKAAFNQAQTNLDVKNNSLSGSSNAYDKEITNWEIELSNKNRLRETAQNKLGDLLDSINKEFGFSDSLDRIADLRKALAKANEAVAKERENAVGAVIEAPITGTISTINVTSGRDTVAGAAVVTMLPEGAGFTLSFTVTNEQARRLSPGVQADLVNSWRYDDVTVTLAAIRPDPQNPSQQKLLVFNVTGNVNAGQSISVSVGDRSANYDMVVPNSAIREDSNGKFVLIVESRATPLSTRYTATRVDVEVVASDDTRSAITGGLYAYDYVITTSDSPVSAGQQIRLADN